LLFFSVLLFLLCPTIAHAQAAQNDWPHPRGGLSGTGISTSPLADAYELAWTYTTGGAVLSSAVIVNGIVYVGSEDKHLHAINAATGQRVWAFEADRLIDASPIVDEGVVYIGTDGGAFHALDAATGEPRWLFQTGGRIAGEAGVTTLTEEDGSHTKVVLVGSHDGLLYCINAATGEQRWTYETGDYINCGVVMDGEHIVLAGCDTYLHLVDRNTGQSLGEAELGGEVAGTPALAHGYAYIGHMQNEVVAVNLASTEIAWRFHDRDFPFVGSPAITADRLLIGSRGRRLYCLNLATGQAIWNIRTEGGVEGSPVISGDRAVYGSAGGRLSIIALEDGATIWQYDLGADIDVSPAVTPGLIVVGSEDGNIYAFRQTQ